MPGDSRRADSDAVNAPVDRHRMMLTCATVARRSWVETAVAAGRSVQLANVAIDPYRCVLPIGAPGL